MWENYSGYYSCLYLCYAMLNIIWQTETISGAILCDNVVLHSLYSNQRFLPYLDGWASWLVFSSLNFIVVIFAETTFSPYFAIYMASCWLCQAHLLHTPFHLVGKSIFYFFYFLLLGY